MRALLIIFTILEILVFVGALAWYLNKLARSLAHTSGRLASTSAGVKAVEGHCAPIGSVVTTLNAQLEFISTEIGTLADLTGLVTSGAPAPPAAGSTVRPE